MFRSYNDREYQTQKSQNTNKQHNCTTYYDCDLCEDKYMSETEVEIHRNISHKKELVNIMAQPESCWICITKQPDRTALIQHIKSEHLLSSKIAKRVEREIFICDYCEQFYFNKTLLEAHISVHHLKIDKFSRVLCPRCHKMIQIQSLWIHFQYHMIQSIACCPICLVKCQNRESLKEHFKTHPRYYQCTVCGYDTKKEQRFHEHISSHKTKANLREIGSKRFFMPTREMSTLKYTSQTLRGLLLPKEIKICILCREICTSRNEMKAHMGSVHDACTIIKKRNFCSCGEEFFNSVLLKQHVFKLKGDHRVCEGVIPKRVDHKAYEDKEMKESTVLTDNTPETVLEGKMLPDDVPQ